MQIATARILQHYEPWQGAVGLTLDAHALGMPKPGQCLLCSPVGHACGVVPVAGLPATYRDPERTIDVLLPADFASRLSGFLPPEGLSIRVLGPVGRPFALDRRDRRALLVDGGSPLAPLLYLVQHLVERGLEVTYLACRRPQVAPVPARALPPEIEYVHLDLEADTDTRPLSRALDDLVPWADGLYASVGADQLPAIAHALRRRLLRLRKGFAQAFIMPTALPCGVGACDLCATKAAGRSLRPCKDGLVFDLLDLV